MNDAKKRAWAEVSLSAIEHNYRQLRAQLAPGTRFLGVVKANAYGHGAVTVSHLLQTLGADYLAVACLDEALELREAGITLPILILGYTTPEYAPVLAEHHITQAVGSLEMAQALSAKLAGGQSLKIHIKIDTGMSRTGFCALKETTLAEAAEACRLPKLQAEGIFTHFAVSDMRGDPFTETQFTRFLAAIAEIEAKSGQSFAIRHCANAGAVINYPKTYLDMVRPGLTLYGYYPDVDHGALELRPAMSLYGRVARIFDLAPGDTVSYGRTFCAEEPRRAAVITIGYADGLHRVLSNKMEMLLGGKRVKQIGRICMDMCMADVTDLPDLTVGERATIFGGEMSLDVLAKQAGTISYELLCSVSPRIPRLYID